MPIRVKCDNCKKTLSVKDHLAGKKIKCPVCQTVVTVQASAPPKASPPGAAPPKATSTPKKPGEAPKPTIATRAPVDKSKPLADKSQSNGVPPLVDKTKSNGSVPPAPEPEPIFLPPENVEEEALSAFTDEPPPVEEDLTPKTIDFKCSWCDSDLQLPIELAGKQTQCTNEDCRRIIKVPMPKVAAKKDWRKMDRQGPAAARINQPEQLDNAWGTQDATKARQDSLAKAGALKEPPKKPLDGFGKLRILFLVTSAVVVLTLVVTFGYKLVGSKQQHNALEQAKQLVGKDAKITNPLLAAEAHRTIGLLYLRSDERKKAERAEQHFQGALPAFEVSDTNPAINEQLFLIELALAQVELGGEGEELLAKHRLEWEQVRKNLTNTLQRIETPEVRVLALREVATRLIEKKQAGLAISLAASLSNGGTPIARLASSRQQIALIFWKGDAEAQKNLPKRPDSKTDADGQGPDAQARIGYAEGHARKGEYEEALELAKIPGHARDRMDAYLGLAAVALQDRKNQEKAAELIKIALNYSREKEVKDQLSSWHLLQLVRLASRTENEETIKELIQRFPERNKTPFKLRAKLEVFQALCEKSPGKIDPEKLADIEADDVEGKASDAKAPETKTTQATPGTTLALAWMMLAQHNGADRNRNRKDFENRAANLQVSVDMLRPMVDVGSFLGSMK